MATATTLTYNGVTINGCKMQTFNQRAHYDDTNTQKLYNEFTIRVRGVVHVGTVTTVGMAPVGASDSAQQYYDCSRLLLEPRAEFRLTLAGGSGLASNTNTDLDNGPKPQSCDILRVSPSSFIVEFEIKIACPCCESQRGLDVLSNRWGTEESYDETGWRTRTYRGRLRVAKNSLGVHNYRGWIVPPLQDGFQRHSMTFTASLDGLTIDYTIMDVEKYLAPPKPAKAWSGVHTTSTGEGGATAFEEISVSLTGGPETNKLELIATAINVALLKLDVKNKPIGTGTGAYLLRSASLVDRLEQNTIEFKCAVQKTIAAPLARLGANGNKIGLPIEADSYDPLKWPVPTPTQYKADSSAAAFVSYLQSPCDSIHEITANPSANSPAATSATVQPSSSTTRVVTTTGTLPKDPALANAFSISHSRNMYTFYHIETRYKKTGLIAQLPVGGNTNLTCTLVQFGNGLGNVEVKLAAERIGTPPELPNSAQFLEAQLQGVLLEHWNEPKAPKPGPDGASIVYSTDAYYLYALNRPHRDTDPIGTVKLPYIT